MNWKDELEEICGEEYIEAVEELIKSLLKKQRTECGYGKHASSANGFTPKMRAMIENAPEPGEK